MMRPMDVPIVSLANCSKELSSSVGENDGLSPTSRAISFARNAW